MSTKCTLVCGDYFHLYEEVGDPDNVYLRLENADFEVHRNEIMVTIPVEIWENIRQVSIAGDLKFAEYTDEQIEQHVTQHLKNIKLTEDVATLWLFGFMFGDLLNTSEEEQIEKGVEYFINLRNKQQEIKNKINNVKEQIEKWNNKNEQY